MHEVHAFRGEATIGGEYSFGYEPGTRHAVIVFSRQDSGSDLDFALAARRAHDNGLLDVVFDDGGKLKPEAIDAMPTEFANAYRSALEQGYGVVVYSEPVAEAR
jgi:hypothetical protein